MLRAEFRRRLECVFREIRLCLEYDEIRGNLLPALASLFRYMWCKTTKDHKYSSEPDTLDY